MKTTRRTDVEKSVRRHLLKPLAAPAERPLNVTTYKDSVRLLEDRAAGENLMTRAAPFLREMATSERKARGDDPDHVEKFVTLVKALYASRRISRQEFVFFGASEIEQIQSNRIFANYYADVVLLSQAIDRVEKEHGLAPGHYWLRGQGPSEHVRLNKEYEVVTHKHFLNELRSFGLDELAEFAERDWAEFSRLRERGRRSVFHKDEYIHAIRDVVVLLKTEAQKAASAGAYFAAITSLAAGIEGLLVLRCLRSLTKAARVAKSLPKRIRPQDPNNPGTWRFETLIEACVAAGWLRQVETEHAVFDTAGLAHLLRTTRNHVHPARSARARPWLKADEREYNDAAAIYALLATTLGRISPRK